MAQKSALNEIREVKDFHVVKWHAKKQTHNAPNVDKVEGNCKYCSIRHPQPMPSTQHEMQWVKKVKPFKMVCRSMQW